MIFFPCGSCRYPLAIPYKCRRCHPPSSDAIARSKFSFEELLFNLHDPKNLLELFMRIRSRTNHTLNKLVIRLTANTHLAVRRQCNSHLNEVEYDIPYGATSNLMFCRKCLGFSSRDFVTTYPQPVSDEEVHEITKRVMGVHTRYNEPHFGYVFRSIVKQSNCEMFKIMIASGCKAEIDFTHTIDIDSHQNGGCLEVMLAIGTTLTDNLLSRRALELSLVSSDLDAQVQLMLAYNLHPGGVHSLLMSFNNAHPLRNYGYSVFNHISPKTISFLKRDDILPLQHLAMVAYRKNEILKSIDFVRSQIKSYN